MVERKTVKVWSVDSQEFLGTSQSSECGNDPCLDHRWHDARTGCDHDPTGRKARRYCDQLRRTSEKRRSRILAFVAVTILGCVSLAGFASLTQRTDSACAETRGLTRVVVFELAGTHDRFADISVNCAKSLSEARAFSVSGSPSARSLETSVSRCSWPSSWPALSR